MVGGCGVAIGLNTRPPPLLPLLILCRNIPALFPFRRSLWIQADNSNNNNDDVDPITTASSSSSSSPPPQEKRRQQQAHRRRLASVIDTVNDRKLPHELRNRPNAIRSETDIVNVVEQRIWRSMEAGHFENLPGKGKPLDLGTNPHADPAEDTLYRILSRNGCAPDWVELNKEIRCRNAEWRLAVKKAWADKVNNHGSTWSKDSESLKGQMRDINDKVLHYNLIAPFGRQMFLLKWEKETDKLQ